VPYLQSGFGTSASPPWCFAPPGTSPTRTGTAEGRHAVLQLCTTRNVNLCSESKFSKDQAVLGTTAAAFVTTAAWRHALISWSFTLTTLTYQWQHCQCCRETCLYQLHLETCDVQHCYVLHQVNCTAVSQWTSDGDVAHLHR